MRRRFPWSVIFIATALLALAAVPVWVERVVSEAGAEMRKLELARRKAAEIETIHARQMTRFQEYLLTGSLVARDQYNALLERESQQFDTLRLYLETTEFEGLTGRVRVEPADLSAAAAVRNRAAIWQLEHRGVLESPDSIPGYLQHRRADLDRYEGLLRVSGDFREHLSERAARAQEWVEYTRWRFQGLLTGLLALMALAATVATARLARHLNLAVEEATRRRKDALRARREIDAILEATAEAVLGVDLSGRVIRLNQAGSRLLGFTEEDARGRRFHRVLHAGFPVPEDTGELPEARAMRDALLAGNAVAGVDGQVHPRRGGVVGVRWSLRPLVDGQEVRGAVITLTDMREVRAAERALKRAVRAREETMAVVGHDLRSPLSSIAAAAELLLDVPLPEDRRRLQLESIQSAADRMTRLIGDLMDLSRIDTGGLRVILRSGELTTLLERSLRLAEPRADQDRVRLKRDWSPDLCPVDMDDHRILQVLSNLIANALRYTEPGGSVEVGAIQRADEVEVWVQDDGCGIAEEDLPYLWDPFWQPDRDRQARQEGAGLGLAIVKGIVEAHRGRVQVDSAPGKGSRFAFTLPRTASPATLPSSPPGS
jgi:PAS domain S-box-containing protein